MYNLCVCVCVGVGVGVCGCTRAGEGGLWKSEM